MAENVGYLSLLPKCVGRSIVGMRSVVIVTFEGGQSLDVTGPLEVFSVATQLLKLHGRSEPGYRIAVAAVDAGPVRMSSGLQLVAEVGLAQLRRPVDTLVVAGGMGTGQALGDTKLLRSLQRLAPRARRVTSVCSGAFLLAEAGLLKGRRATTHWNWCDVFSERYPDTTLDPDAIFVRDGNVWTSAGVTAGIDLALAMVEEDFDHALALEVARQLVMFVQRPGGQSQFSATLRAQKAETEGLRELPSYIAEHLRADLSVPALAQRAGMSARTFARAFARELGETPARYVERTRVEAAQRALTRGSQSLEEVAAAAGFGSAEILRRAFQRHLHVNPKQYRQHFAAQPR